MVQASQTLTFLKQTRIYSGDLPHQRGNSFPTVIACLMGLSDPEEVFQVQEQYDHDSVDDPQNWVYQLQWWLNERGLQWKTIKGHCYDGSVYVVVGQSRRGKTHVCLYQYGKLLHDPHPDGGGLITETEFETITFLYNE